MWATFRVARIKPWTWAVAARRPSTVAMGLGDSIGEHPCRAGGGAGVQNYVCRIL